MILRIGVFKRTGSSSKFAFLKRERDRERESNSSKLTWQRHRVQPHGEMDQRWCHLWSSLVQSISQWSHDMQGNAQPLPVPKPKVFGLALRLLLLDPKLEQCPDRWKRCFKGDLFQQSDPSGSTRYATLQPSDHIPRDSKPWKSLDGRNQMPSARWTTGLS